MRHRPFAIATVLKRPHTNLSYPYVFRLCRIPAFTLAFAFARPLSLVSVPPIPVCFKQLPNRRLRRLEPEITQK